MAKKRTFPIYAVEDPEGWGMTEKQYKQTWQKGVNSGVVWKLQGWYGRNAAAMLKSGYLKFPTRKTFDYYGNPIPVRKRKR